MWGSHVDSELEKATRKASNDKQAQQKVKMVLRKLLGDDDAAPQFRDPGPGVAGGDEPRDLPPVKSNKSFRDPASVIRTGE